MYENQNVEKKLNGTEICRMLDYTTQGFTGEIHKRFNHFMPNTIKIKKADIDLTKSQILEFILKTNKGFSSKTYTHEARTAVIEKRFIDKKTKTIKEYSGEEEFKKEYPLIKIYRHLKGLTGADRDEYIKVHGLPTSSAEKDEKGGDKDELIDLQAEYIKKLTAVLRRR